MSNKILSLMGYDMPDNEPTAKEVEFNGKNYVEKKDGINWIDAKSGEYPIIEGEVTVDSPFAINGSFGEVSFEFSPCDEHALYISDQQEFRHPITKRYVRGGVGVIQQSDEYEKSLDQEEFPMDEDGYIRNEYFGCKCKPVTMAGLYIVEVDEEVSELDGSIWAYFYNMDGIKHGVLGHSKDGLEVGLRYLFKNCTLYRTRGNKRIYKRGAHGKE